ncbi:bifunctional diguanylate cyclase/phosphodiesterase [Thalassospira sp.]|uniref:sensor domain-containing protein n=1 Tax=Thalassospira sp. TaxID=1912094 RepID=UPI0027341763|nr:diguanylate cyclase [Thalassospira sp.]MDP2698589.1 diguanylate cyclase [Thalassospira sp.]
MTLKSEKKTFPVHHIGTSPTMEVKYWPESDDHQFHGNLSADMAQDALRAIGLPVYVKNHIGQFVGFNTAFSLLLDKAPTEILGRTIEDLISDPSLCEKARDTDRTILQNGGNVTYEASLSMADGTEQFVMFGKSRLTGRNGDPNGLIGMALDLTARFQAEQAVRSMALTDPVTGIANRNHFYVSLESAFKRARRSGRTFGLLLVDLDGYKTVNDQYGHIVGDAVLASVARHLCDTLRDSDLVARYGGDEFAVITEDLAGPNDADAIAAKILAALNEPLERHDHPVVRLGASIGIACCPTDGDSIQTLLSKADAALYHAKGNGRCCHFSWTQMRKMADAAPDIA